MPRSRNSRSTATRARPTATGVPCKTTVVRSDWHSTRAPVSASTRFAVAPFAPTTNPLFPAVSTNHTDSRGSRSCDAGCESRASWSSVRASREGVDPTPPSVRRRARRDRATRRGSSTPRSRRGQVLAPGLGDPRSRERAAAANVREDPERAAAANVREDPERAAAANVRGGSPAPVPRVPRMVPRVVPRVPPALRSNAASRPSLRRCASSTVSGRGHVVQAPRASVIAAKRPVERIANSLDVGDQRRGGSRARLVPHHARVHVRVPLVSRRGRVGHDAELMGSLGNATGAIEGSKHGLHATRAGTVRRGRGSRPGEFGDLVLSTSDADADDGAARGSERVQGVLRVAGDARGVRGGGGGVRGTVGARRAQLLHLRAREEDGRRVLERRGTRTIVRGVRVPRGGSSARVRRETWVVRAAGMRSRVTAGGAWARTVARERRVSREIGASTRRVGRARAAGGLRSSRACGGASRGAGVRPDPRPPRPWSPRPPRPPRPPSRSPRPRAPRPPSRASPARSRRWSFEGDRPRGGDRPRSRSRLRLRLVRRARSGRRSASSSSSSTTSTVVPLRARRWASSSAPASASSAGASSRPSRRGEPSLRRSSGTPASTSLSASAGVHGRQRRVALGGISTSRVIIRARGIGEPVARVVAHLQRARPHQATLSDPRSAGAAPCLLTTRNVARAISGAGARREDALTRRARGRSEGATRRHEGVHDRRIITVVKWEVAGN